MIWKAIVCFIIGHKRFIFNADVPLVAVRGMADVEFHIHLCTRCYKVYATRAE